MPTITLIAPDQGHQNNSPTAMSITGTFINGAATRVNFGTRSVTGTATATVVTCPIPTLCAGSYSVSVSQGTATSNSLPFYYIGTPVISKLIPNAGEGNDTTAPANVDIYGSNLSTATAANVLFGTAAATALIPGTDNHITVTPPPHLPAADTFDTMDVTVTTLGGLSLPAGSAGQFSYYIPPTATTALAPDGTSTGPIGTEVTVTGDHFVEVSQVLFGTVPADSFNVISATSLTAVVAAGTTTGSVFVTNPGGTNATGPTFTIP